MSDEEEQEVVDTKVGRYAGLRFVKFSNIVEQIGGDNSKLSRRLMLTDSTEGTFFTDTLTKWNDQDHSAAYSAFVEEIPSDELQSFAQLLYHKDLLARTLLEHMSLDAKSKSIPAFCELLAALARDLKEEFDEYMWPSFEALTNVLDLGEQEKDSVEAAFYCLAILVKVLWKKLAKNVKKSFLRFVPLFGSSREYVRRFAAESFAFVMRKLPDLRDVVTFIVEHAHKVYAELKDEHFKEGAAALFFNIYKGWSGGFHSAAEQQLDEIFNGVLAIDLETYDSCYRFGQDLLARMLDITIAFAMRHRQTKLAVVEAVLLKNMEMARIMKTVDCYLKLTVKLFETGPKGDIFLSDRKRLFSIFVAVLDSDFFRIKSNAVTQFVIQSIKKVFTDSSWNSSIREMLSKLAKSKEVRKNEQVFYQCSISLSKAPCFNLHFMPYLGEISGYFAQNRPEYMFQFIRGYEVIVTARTPYESIAGIERAAFFDVSKHLPLRQYILKELPKLDAVKPLYSDFNMITVWPWLFNTTEKVEGAEHVQRILIELLRNPNTIDKISYYAGASLYLAAKDYLASIPAELFEKHVVQFNCSYSSILLLRLYILSTGVQHDVEYLRKIAKLLTPAFFSPNSSTRKAALQVLDAFSVPWEGAGQRTEDGDLLPAPEGLFNILISAESTDLTDSRGRLLHFRKLLFGPHARQLPKGFRQEFEHIILRVGLAQFFVQFTLLWPGMHELLGSFARGMDIDAFWSIMKEILEEVESDCRRVAFPYDHFLEQDNRSDYLSCRVQILKFLATISDLAERRTRVLSPLMLTFYGQYFGDNCTPQVDQEPGKEKQQFTSVDKKKALCAYLNIFARFRDANSVYNESSIRSMYEKLLCYPASEILKSTLACVFTYRNKALAPYRENFDALAEDKTFKDQLVLFKIAEDEGDAVVHVDHRSEVMPVLLRLLFGKLLKTSKDKTAVSRRMAIFRYLGGCRPDELQLFLELMLDSVTRLAGSDETAFEQIETYCGDLPKLRALRVDHLISTVTNIYDLIRRIPPGRLTDAQETLLLRTLLCLGVVARDGIQHGAPEQLEKAREMRKLIMETITEFFTAFSTRRLTAKEVVQLFSVAVECYLDEGKTQKDEWMTVMPLSLLRFTGSICQLPSFWPLLTVQVGQKSLLELLIRQFDGKAVTAEHVQTIRQALLSLLTLSDEKLVVDLTGIEHLEVYVNNKGTNYGTSLLVLHLPLVLNLLSSSLESESKSKSISSEILEIQNRLCEFVTDGDYAEQMAQILLGQLERSLPREDTLQKMLLTLAKLVRLVEKPVEYLARIGRLFATVAGRIGREALVQVVVGLRENVRIGEELKKPLSLVADLESWDGRRVDEPDHDRRHAAYNKLFEMWSSGKAYVDAFISTVIHVHFHTLFTTSDIALRSSSASNIRSLCEHIARSPYEEAVKTKLIDKNVISLMLKGFRNDAETVREESIRCLNTLVTSFPSHPQLSAFVPLQSKDEDVDFFTNLNHIQLHRRQRCINKLVNSIREGKVSLPFEVLYRFLVPIIYHYLAAFTSKTSTLSDECLRLFSVTLELAPWARYISTLDHWISRLDRDTGSEKPIIRVLVAIIDAFHFDVAEVNETLAEDGSNSAAVGVKNKLTKEILPRLRKCINGKSARVHKKAKTAEHKQYNEDDDIMRAPVALATTKLLQKLPESIRKQHLHGVILKLCYLMISRSFAVRETARKVTLQVCDCLGAKYLPSIIKEMKMIMSKGFQVHVMIYTVHSFIFHMQERLEVGDLDACLDEIIDLSIKDQFEDAADEKEVGAIRAEIQEAKGNKTPDTLLLLGKFVSATSLGLVLGKLQDVLEKKSSSKAVMRVGNLLTKFATGIKDNNDLPPSNQLILVHQVLSTNIEKMETTGVKRDPEQSSSSRPESCLLLPEAPKRVGALVKTSVKSRVHVFVEFALQLLSYLIAERKFSPEEATDIAKLDPFVPLVNRCLTLKYDKVISLALRCMTGLLYMDAPSLHGQLKSLSERLFVLLSDYSVMGSAGNKSSVLQLNQLLFKAFTKVISMGSTSLLTNKNVALLLSYIETDVMDTQKQATAFSLIKAIIRKRIEHERLPEVIQLLAELSVTSPQSIIRTQSRDTVCEFIGNHPQAEEPKKWLEFFAAQLEYEYEDGRMSAAETLHKLFGEFLTKVLDENCFFCLLKMAARLVNDDSPKCRKYVAATLRKLLEGVSESSLDEAAAAGSDWLESETEASRAVGVEILVQLSHVEGERFVARIGRILTAVSSRLAGEELLQENSESTLTALLDGLVVMLKNSGTGAAGPETSPLLYEIIGRLQPLAKCNDSASICRSASALIGQCLSYWTTAPSTPTAKDLVDWMCWQLKHRELSDELAEQSSKNVVYLSQWLSAEEFEKTVKRLASICKFEIAKNPKEAIKRMSCFKLAAALSVRYKEGSAFNIFVREFFPLLVREMNRRSIAHTEELANMATEVSELIKTRLGEKDYAAHLAQSQKELIDKTEDRKRKVKELAVLEPQKAAEAKRKKNVKKVEAKKRKIDEMKPYRVSKRRNLERKRLQEDED